MESATNLRRTSQCLRSFKNLKPELERLTDQPANMERELQAISSKVFLTIYLKDTQTTSIKIHL